MAIIYSVIKSNKVVENWVNKTTKNSSTQENPSFFSDENNKEYLKNWNSVEAEQDMRRNQVMLFCFVIEIFIVLSGSAFVALWIVANEIPTIMGAMLWFLLALCYVVVSWMQRQQLMSEDYHDSLFNHHEFEMKLSRNDHKYHRNQTWERTDRDHLDKSDTIDGHSHFNTHSYQENKAEDQNKETPFKRGMKQFLKLFYTETDRKDKK